MTRMQTADLLAALANYAGQPPDRAVGPPPFLYTSEAFLQLEIENVFQRGWICIGRDRDLGEAGDFLTFDIAGQPVFAVRQNDAAIRTFGNSCLHRCSRLLEGAGNVGRIVCPYHAWTYERDGRLIGTPYMEDLAGFDRAGQRLVELRTELWQGFIYVTLDPDIEPLSASLADLEEILSRYPMTEYVSLVREEEVWNTNWKCLAENFMESYHLFRVHPTTFEPYTPTALAQPRPGGDAYSLQYCPRKGGVAPGDLRPGDNVDAAPGLTVVTCVYPAHLISISPEYMWYLSLQPQGTAQVRVHWTACVTPELLASAPDREQFVRARRSVHDAANGEDRAATEAAYRGLNARLARPGRLHPLENTLFEFWQYLARRLEPARGHAGPA